MTFALPFSPTAPCTTKRKEAKKLRKDRANQRPTKQCNNKTSRVTTRAVYHGVTCSRSGTTTQNWFKSDVINHDVTYDGRGRQGDMNTLNYVTPDCVTPSNTTSIQPYWPIISSPEISKTNSYHEITVADLSLKQVIGITNPLPSKPCNYVTLNTQYGFNNSSCYYDNDTSLGGDEGAQSYFPRISLEDVNNVLQSCNYITSQDQPRSGTFIQSNDIPLAEQTVVVNSVRPMLDDECMASVSMECLEFEDNYQGIRELEKCDNFQVKTSHFFSFGIIWDVIIISN